VIQTVPVTFDMSLPLREAVRLAAGVCFDRRESLCH
jgi:hypothetical protein